MRLRDKADSEARVPIVSLVISAVLICLGACADFSFCEFLSESCFSRTVLPLLQVHTGHHTLQGRTIIDSISNSIPILQIHSILGNTSREPDCHVDG